MEFKVSFDKKFASKYGYIAKVEMKIVYSECQFADKVFSFQPDESRFYVDPRIYIESDDVRKLKNMNKLGEFDSQFIGLLLDCAFEKEKLKRCSVGGKQSNFNGQSHEALDKTKLGFIQGSQLSYSIFRH